MAGKSGSKNNVANRGKAVQLKKIDGKEVKPVKFKGKMGSVIAAAFTDGKLVKDKVGNVVPYKNIL